MSWRAGEGDPEGLLTRTSRARLGRALGDSTLWLGIALLLLVLAVSQASRAGLDLPLDAIGEGLDGALIATVVLALVRRPRHVEDRGTRRFWTLLAAGFAIWAVVEIVYGFAPTGDWPRWLQVVVECGFLVSYSSFLLATFEDPEEEDPAEPRWIGRRFLRRATVALALTMLGVYLIVLPEVMTGRGSSTTSSFLVYVLLDGVIAARLWAGALGIGGGNGDRLPRALLAVAFTSWFASDLSSLVHRAFDQRPEVGALADLLWYVPFVPAIAAGGLRRIGAHGSAAPAFDEVGATEGRTGGDAAWPYYFVALVPLLVHFAGSAAGLFDGATHEAREVSVFAYVVVMSGVMVLSAALHASRLRWAQQRAQQLRLESLGRLAGGVAHEFNNLLQVVVGYTEMLRDRVGADGKADAEIGNILAASQRATTLTRQLLVFARRVDDEPEVIDARARLLEIHQVLRRLIPEDIALDLDADRRGLRLRIAPGQLDQVLTNLVLNARDAVRSPGARIVIGLERPGDGSPPCPPEVPAGEWVRIVVEDNGVGMSPAARRRAFDPFFTTKPVGHGTGLGLSVVWGIVREAGGRVGFTSESGRGTRFEIYLPLAEAPAEASAAAVASAARTESAAPTRVLLVEDDREVAESLARGLERAGYDVVVARDAAAGEARLVDPGVALVVTDVVMPGGSGVALARRAAQLRPGLPVIYLSGHPDEVLRERGVGRADRLIRKPADLDVLVAEIEGRLARAGA